MDIVDSMHELWTRVSLKHNANLLSMILQKSSTQPLLVSYKEGEINDEDKAGFKQRITPSAGRWKSLDYWAYPEAQHERMLGLPLHNLETLIIHIPYSTVNYTGVFDAPRLRDLDVFRLSLNWHSFSDLRSLQIEDCVPSPSVDEVYIILKASPNLEVFKIARIRPTSPTGHLADVDDAHSAPIHLPRLRSLLVVRVPFVPYSRLLNLIEAPNLHRFLVFHHFRSPSQSNDFTPMFESAGRFIGTHRESSDDDDAFRLTVLVFDHTLAVVVGHRRVLLQNEEWTGGRQEEQKAGLSAALRRFDKRLCESIKAIQFAGMRSDEEMMDFAHILNQHFPNVEELLLKLSLWTTDPGGLPTLGRLSSLSNRGRGNWLFPKLIALHLSAPEALICDGILEVVEARRNVGHVQPIQQLTIEGSKIGRDAVVKLETYLQQLRMTGTEIV
ncbi:hypothetical protein FRC04_001099 [Tulasnella sp. 424]|nr:hypothetical protein FRC04_001099 [Tulasnella sp. 424]